MLEAIKLNKISAHTVCVLSIEESSTMQNEMALVWGEYLNKY